MWGSHSTGWVYSSVHLLACSYVCICGAVVVACVSKLVSSTTCSHYAVVHTAFLKCVSVCKLVGHLSIQYPVCQLVNSLGLFRPHYVYSA